MKRTEFLKPVKPLARMTPLKRTAFQRAIRKEGGSIARIRIKSRGPKMTPIRKAARDQECTLNFWCCTHDTATTIWAHSNRSADGKGMGIKARDSEGCSACYACHSWLDGGYAGHMPRAEVDAAFDRARAKSHQILARLGLIKVGPPAAATAESPDHANA